MFDKRDQLQERLSPVSSALRGVRFWRGAALILLAAAIVAALLIAPVRDGRIAGSTAAWIILAVAAITIAIVAVAAARSFRDPREIARRIERRFPSLGQRLLTAIQVTSAPRGEPLGYLQRRIIDEADQHSKTHRWVEVVPTKQVLLSRLAGGIGLVAMTAMLWILATSGPPYGPASQGRSSTQRPISIQIEPGNVEIERGTSLIVTARFDERDPIGGQAELVCVAEDGSERRYPMKRTLDDPVLSAFVSSVDSSLRYKVVLSHFESDVFSADVFDYPSLTRADAELDYPSYTALQRKRIEDTLRVAAVEGTGLQWELNVNQPLERATLVDADGNRLELELSSESPTRYVMRAQMTQTQRWRLELLDLAGRENKFPPELVARVLPNEPPSLKIVAGGDAEVSPLEEFPVAVQVRDDYGVERFGLSYLFPGGKGEDIVLGTSIPRGQTQRGDYLIDFEALGAKPDQLLAYHFWAEDTGPDGSTRRIQGDLHFAEVRPLEEIYREDELPDAGGRQDRSQQQGGGGSGAQAEELAELQKNIINATWKVLRRETGDERSAEFAGDVESILTGQTDALDRLTQLETRIDDEQSLEFVQGAATSMRSSLTELERAISESATKPLGAAVEAQQAAYQSLLGLRAREFQVSRSREQNQQRGGSASARQRQQRLNELDLKNDENRYETQAQAQEETQQQGREQREVIDRLRELAQRQEDINKQVAQLQSALELAESEEEKREIERQLKRLRDQQQDMLRDADELAERMQQTQSSQQDSQAAQNAAEQLQQTRENIRQAADALSQNNASEALAAGTRAERELDEMREELRQQAAGNFEEAMRQIRSAAQELDQRQQAITEQMNNQEAPATDQPGLRPEVAPNNAVEDLQAQRQRLSRLLEQIEETVQQAESSEPLLAQSLYDTYRHTQQQKVDRKLNDTAELLRRGMQDQAEQLQEQTGEAISNLRERLESAAESVLGDQTKALERALGELEQLQQQLDSEIEAATGRGARGGREAEDGDDARERSDGQPQGQPSDGPSAESAQPRDQSSLQPGGAAGQSGRDPSDPQAEQESGQQRGGSSPREESEQQQPDGQQAGGQRGGGQQGEQPPEGGQQTGNQQQAGGQPGQPDGDQPRGGRGMIDQVVDDQERDAQARGGEQRGDQQRGGATVGGGGEERRGGLRRQYAPLTGEDYRQWSDRLRDVEQMIEDPALRSEATRIRERAREARGEFRRHSSPPQWDGVEAIIARPLRELTKNVAEELLRRSADRHAVVPIDRDPVPDRFTDAVRRYYESLGSGQ